MASTETDIRDVELTPREHWVHGPHELSARCASKCPIHWTESFEEFPNEGELLVGDDCR